MYFRWFCIESKIWGILENPGKFPVFSELWGWGILRDLDSGIFGACPPKKNKIQGQG
jgi:hypothetical protein